MRLILLLRYRWKCLLTYCAEIQHDSSLKIWADAGTELQRAREIAVLTERVLLDARAEQRDAGWKVMRHDRLGALKIGGVK